MRRICFLLAFFALSLPASGRATIRVVPLPYPTIQSAIDASVAGDTVVADPGTYPEPIDFLGKEILVGSRYVTTGDTSHVTRTVIDCALIAGAHVVRFTAGETPASRLSGFTVTGGSAAEGAGIYCRESSPTLDHLRIVHNHAQSRGGGFSAYGGRPTVTACLIAENTTLTGDGDGGGIWAQFSDIVIDDNEVRRNRCTFRGAGIFCEYSNQTITDNQITDNLVDGLAGYNGGGITSRDCAPLIAGNFIAGNDGGGFGGGLFY